MPFQSPDPNADALTAEAVAHGLRRLLARGVVRSLTGCGSPAQPPGLDGHRLTRWPFFKVPLRGRLEILDGDGTLTFTAHPGEALYFPAGTYANVRYPEPSEHFRVTMMSDATFLAWNGIVVPDDAPDGRIQRLRGHMLARRPSRLARELVAHLGKWTDAGARRDAWRMLCREWIAELSAPSPAPVPGRTRFLEIRRYLEEHSHESITRESVAAAFRLSPGFVSRLFRQHHADGFHATLARLRLGHAQALLATSDLLVADVAARCGFTSQNYFAQAFRRAEGMSPREWRSLRRLTSG